jgi:hypothetical protein
MHVVRRQPRLVLAAALIPGAVVVGGPAGIIAAFAAVLLVIDRGLERMTGHSGLHTSAAEHDFARLRRERRRAARRGDADLTYLPLDSGWAALAQRRPLGVGTIPAASIVGTVDEHKAEAFDSSFRPPEWSRGRWTLMARAMRGGATLPPISVYRVAGEHYVRDGHHRVSVARALGVDSIEAEVVELRT